MKTAAAIRMGRIPVDPERPKACEAVAPGRHCPRPRGAEKAPEHAATYRVEKTNPETGEIWRRHFCTGASAAWASRHHIDFPPGLWDRKDTDHGIER